MTLTTTTLKKYLLPLLAVLLLTGCDDDDEERCPSDSDFSEFECVLKKDFVDASGNSTALSQKIANCTILSSNSSVCTLSQLGFIANTSTTPTKQQILDKLIVSDPWMASNFSTLLDAMPADMYNLFSSVTAIVIHSEIRPAFFWSATGAIYLDAEYLWLTEEQRKSISQKADYRSNYGSQLKFIPLYRYTKNGAYAFGTEDSRTQTQALYSLSALLFHELAHARDFFPVVSILAASGTKTPNQINADSGTTSQQLSLAQPLEDEVIEGLAGVLFYGDAASPAQKSLTALQVGTLFEVDGANDLYNYSARQEDAAMLFEETMLKIHYNIDRELAFGTPLANNIESCDDLSFDWIDINRYADPLVIPRVKQVVDGLLPGHTHTAFLNAPVADGSFTWCGAGSPRGILIPGEKLPFDRWL